MPFIHLPFLEQDTPPPFYRAELGTAERKRLDAWFIGERSQDYYLRRFAEFDNHGRLYARWHWAAFFATFGWLLYRKRYMDCFVYLVAGLSFVKLNIVLVVSLCEFLFISVLPNAWQMPMRVLLGSLVWLFWAAMVARWSDAYYYRMARREIADALDMYPNDPQAQQAHLQHHGGVSLLGLGLAYGLFAAVLAIFGGQFVPLIAIQKQQEITSEALFITNHTRVGVNQRYHKAGCPVGAVDWVQMGEQARDRFTLSVSDTDMGFGADCMLIAQVQGLHYPIGYLNKRKMIWYHDLKTDKWNCVTNLNQENQFIKCR